MEKEMTENLAFPETDLTLVVEGQKIHVNKLVLAAHSPVFDRMFRSQFKESTANEIELKDKKAEDVAEFLNCFYPGKNRPVTAENVLQVLPIAHEYQSPLVTDCEDFMIAMCKPDERLTVSTLLDYILVGEKYGLTRFLEEAVELCALIDFHFLHGSEFKFTQVIGNSLESRDKNIALKFSEVSLQTRYAISKKRLLCLEMYYRSNPDPSGKDVTIPLS